MNGPTASTTLPAELAETADAGARGILGAMVVVVDVDKLVALATINGTLCDIVGLLVVEADTAAAPTICVPAGAV